MTDYIKREDAIKLCIDIIDYRTTELVDMGEVLPSEKKNVIKIAFKKLPSADVVERKRGEWIAKANNPHNARWLCSACNYATVSRHNFCPNCGADMRGE